MHDAVRADVLQALLSGGRARCTRRAVTDLADHSDDVPRASSPASPADAPEPRGRRRGRGGDAARRGST